MLMPEKIVNNKELFINKRSELLDPLAYNLSEEVKWFSFNELSYNNQDLFPIAILGEGPPLLLIHGFDSSLLEFRRIAPLIDHKFSLIIPDLYGFGFSPRPKEGIYNKESIVNHLGKIINLFYKQENFGIVGASMGGAIAIELARKYPNEIDKLLLLSPAGLTGKQIQIPEPFNHLGACLLEQKSIRTMLCKQAFANPSKDVGEPEKQIASFHVKVPGWKQSLASFAKSGGVAGCGIPVPKKPIHVIWGSNDRILSKKQKEGAKALLRNNQYEEIDNCGHLPHIDQPKTIANIILNGEYL